MLALYVYNAALHNSANDAASEAGGLCCVDGTTEQLTVGQLDDTMNAINKSLMYAGSCFKVVCNIGEDFYDNLDEFDRSLYLNDIINEHAK